MPPRCHPVPHGLALWIARQSGHVHAVGGAFLKFVRGVHRASSQSFFCKKCDLMDFVPQRRLRDAQNTVDRRLGSAKGTLYVARIPSAGSCRRRLPWLGHVGDIGREFAEARSRGNPEVSIPGRSGSAQIYASLTARRDEEAPIIGNQDLSHGSQPRKPHSRARLRDLGRT